MRFRKEKVRVSVFYLGKIAAQDLVFLFLTAHSFLRLPECNSRVAPLPQSPHGICLPMKMRLGRYKSGNYCHTAFVQRTVIC